MKPNFEEYLFEYLNAYWLRPVTALVRSLEAEVLQLTTFKGGRNLELACGDGVNSLIASGKKVPTSFDVFESLELKPARSFLDSEQDIYDSFQDVRSRDIITEEPFWEKAYDHKINLLQKAELTGNFRELVERNLNDGINEEESTYDLVFSNSLYWLENQDKILKQIFDCLKPGGIAKLSIIKPSFLSKMAWAKLDKYRFKRLIDMGRHSHYSTIESEEKWIQKFEKVGFQVNQIIPTFNDNLVHLIEFHDYREISPITAFMAKSLSSEALIESKTHWVNYFHLMFNEMKTEGFFECTAENSNYNIFILRK